MGISRLGNVMSEISSEKVDLYWTPERMLEVAHVSDVQICSDGSKVVYCIKRAIFNEDINEDVTHLFLGETGGGESVQLTAGDRSSFSPAWSFDGKMIAFLRSCSGKNDIWLVRIGGGDAWQLTDVKTKVESFIWSPDGKMIAFTSPDPASDEEEQAKKKKSDVTVVDEDRSMSHIWVVDVDESGREKADARRLTGGDFSVAGQMGSSFGDWSPDGKSIAFSHTVKPGLNSWTTSSISRVDVETGKITAVTCTDAAEFSPLYSPDGRSIAYLSSDNPPGWYMDLRICVVDLREASTVNLAHTRDRMPHLCRWAVDCSRIYFWESRGTGGAFSALPLDGSAPVDIIVEGRELTGFNMSSQAGLVGFCAQQGNFPVEAYVSGIDKFSPVQVSRSNTRIFRLKLGETEVIRWKSSDGLEIEGLLTYPVNYEKGKRYPLIVQVHGGPAGVFSNNFLAALESQYPLAALAEMGFLILRPNIRGSCGYGIEFRKANLKDIGGRDYGDLMAGVDYLIAMGIADGERLGVMGASYGGYMTAWIITQTRRFRAASCKAAITDLISDSGTTDVVDFNPCYLGGRFQDDPSLYVDRSPIFKIKGATTPLLIQHGQDDERVPVSQSLELYRALKSEGTPVRMVLYPQTGHSGGFTPGRYINFRNENIQWFRKYLLL